MTQKQIDKYNWAIKYIKEEHSTGRHILACLGSAGYTFNDDIDNLKKYAESIGEYDFLNLFIEQGKLI